MILQRLTGLEQLVINNSIEAINTFQVDKNAPNTVNVPSQSAKVAERGDFLRNFDVTDRSQELRFKFNGNGDTKAYWLPWGEDLGYYIDIPMQNPNANLFLTPTLSGCYLGIRPLDVENHIRVHHWNMHYPNQPTNAELAQFADVRWIVPAGRTDLHGIHQFNYVRPTFAWGEYINDMWYFFFMKNGTHLEGDAQIITRITMNQAR